MKAFKQTGIWWLPNAENQSIAGTLSFSYQDGIILDLIGAFDTVPDPRIGHPIILGLLESVKEVTLYDARLSNFHMSFPGFNSQEFKITVAYIGAHFEQGEMLAFRKFAVGYNYLPQWLNLSGFTHNRHSDENNKFARHEVSFSFPSEFRSTLDGAALIITHDFSVSPGSQEVLLHQRSFVKFELQESLGLQEILNKFVGSIQNLLSLATMHPHHIDDISIYIINDEDKEAKVQVFFEQIYYETDEPKLLTKNDMLFALDDIKDDFDDIISKWVVISKELRITCNLFFGSQYRPSGYSESRFLNLAQAIEIYHRRRGNNKVWPTSLFKRRKASILRNTPKPYKTWLSKQLMYGNEPRLKQRVTELLDIADDVIAPLVVDKAAFAQKVADTRNYFTHYSSNLRVKAAQGIELYWITEALSLLIQRLLLRELAFSSEKCIELFQRNKTYQLVKTQLQNME
jgi:hypothetical protein